MSQFSRLHRELREDLLLHLDYNKILEYLVSSEFSHLSSHSRFWERKAAQVGVSVTQFRRESRASLPERYVECISHYSRFCIPECEPYIGSREGLLRAVEMGDLKLVKYFLGRGTKSNEKSCGLAAKRGVPDIFKLVYSNFERSSSSDLDLIIIYKLARYNRVELLEWVKMQFIFNADDFEFAVAKGAARGGHVVLLEKSVTHITTFCPEKMIYVIGYAALGGRLDLFRSLAMRITLPVQGIDEHGMLVRYAAEGGNRAILDFIDSTEWDAVLEGAARGGHLELLKYAIEKGASTSEFSNAISHAIEKCHPHIIRYLAPSVESPDDRDIADCFYIREQKLTRELVETLYETKFTDYLTVFVGAAINNDIDLLETTYPLLLTEDRILRDSAKDIALENAAGCGNYAAAKWLLEHCNYNKGWAKVAICIGNNAEIMGLLG